ncbi:MAG: hypothetical protein IKV28_06760 [Bacteroidales bacterium]|nr:hypothetical protein [Bacteroidales bacterium]
MTETPFVYNRFVTGANFLSRKQERETMINLLKQNQHILLIDAPRTGKRSLVQRVLSDIKLANPNQLVCHLDLINVRTCDHLLKHIIFSLAGCFATTQNEIKNFLTTHFPLSAPLLPENDDEIPEDFLAPDGQFFNNEQCDEILSGPDRIAEHYNTSIILYLEEFQNISLFNNAEDFLKKMETHFRAYQKTTCIITGSMINAMKYIFHEKKYFYRFAEEVHLTPLAEKDVTDHIMKTFMRVGRVVNQPLAQRMFRTLQGHPWYIAHLSTICFNLTKGYLNDRLVTEALYSLMSIHVPRFRMMMHDLTEYQIHLLRAVCDGVDKFSTANVLNSYNLNSSANVFRLKEALKKKEIITFDEHDIARIIDPLFELWLRTRYFKSSTLE